MVVTSYQSSEGKPATAKQLDYLRRLGCRQTPKDRQEASQLIVTYKEVTR